MLRFVITQEAFDDCVEAGYNIDFKVHKFMDLPVCAYDDLMPDQFCEEYDVGRLIVMDLMRYLRYLCNVRMLQNPNFLPFEQISGTGDSFQPIPDLGVNKQQPATKKKNGNRQEISMSDVKEFSKKMKGIKTIDEFLNDGN
tara:strand:- start:85 stop:507 length:423 start_codon:yes stop_codon:yes gene_type:complete